MKKCPYCGEKINEAAEVCPECGERQPETVYVNPFDKKQYSLIKKFLHTVKALFTSPTKFFESLGQGNGVLNPFFYFLSIIVISGIFNAIWSKVMLKNMQNFMNQFSGSMPQGQSLPSMNQAMMNYSFTGAFLRTVIFGTIAIFIFSAIYHVILMILGEGKNGFENTLKASFFGYTPNLLVVIPFCGGIIGYIWAIVLTIIGLAKLQETSYGKASVAVLAILVLCCFIGMLAALGMGSMATMFNQ